MVCLGNICINTLHKEAKDDDDDDDDDDDNNNNNNLFYNFFLHYPIFLPIKKQQKNPHSRTVQNYYAVRSVTLCT
jgi:hypothetical protein